jgi:LacI family transcriptional regulator
MTIKSDKVRGIKMPSGKKPTLKTISALTGLSLSTVSLSLRGGGALKEETQRKVEEAARTLGYIPDRAGVRLRTGKTNVIALVLDGANESFDFARNLIQGIGEAIRGTRYHLTVMPEFDRDRTVETIKYILENRTADGVIITHTAARDKRVQYLLDHDFPFVSHGRTEFYGQHAYHDFHAERYVDLAVERLFSKGCRNVAVVYGVNWTNNDHTIKVAFERAVARLGIKGRILSHKSQDPDATELRMFGRDIAGMADRPDGIICDSEIKSLPLICGLQENGITLGKDLHFICKETSNILPTIFPMVDTIGEDVYAAGQELTHLLLRRIKGEAPESLQTLSEPTIHWRS